MSSTKWTRREFGKAAAAVAGATLLQRAGLAAMPAAHRFAYVGSGPAGMQDGTLHVFRTGAKAWTPLHKIAAAAPAHLLRHPVMPVLYAVHNVGDWDHLPRGAVSAYAMDGHTGALTLLGSQPLSLSATHPRHAVLTANATHLFVAAEGGGIYNLLPVAPDGTLLPVSAIRKEFGLDEGGVQKLSAPDSVALLPDGSLLAADAGQETLSNFVVQDDQLILRHRTRVHRGEGPASLTLSKDGRHAFTAGARHGEARRHTLLRGKAVDETVVDGTRPLSVAAAEPYVQAPTSLLLV